MTNQIEISKEAREVGRTIALKTLGYSTFIIENWISEQVQLAINAAKQEAFQEAAQITADSEDQSNIEEWCGAQPASRASRAILAHAATLNKGVK